MLLPNLFLNSTFIYINTIIVQILFYGAYYLVGPENAFGKIMKSAKVIVDLNIAESEASTVSHRTHPLASGKGKIYK